MEPKYANTCRPRPLTIEPQNHTPAAPAWHATGQQPFTPSHQTLRGKKKKKKARNRADTCTCARLIRLRHCVETICSDCSDPAEVLRRWMVHTNEIIFLHGNVCHGTHLDRVDALNQGNLGPQDCVIFSCKCCLRLIRPRHRPSKLTSNG